MKISKCPICGKLFEHDRKQTYCKNSHTKICEVCGDTYEIPYSRLSEYSKFKTCRKKECVNSVRAEHIKESQSRLSPGWNKSNQTFKRMCKICNAEFETAQPNKLYCDNQHYKKCIICGSKHPVSTNNWNNHTQTCSYECSRKLAKLTTFELYGSEYYSQTDEWKASIAANASLQEAKRKSTSMTKYGVENYSQTIEWKAQRMRDPSLADNMKEFEDNPEQFIVRHFGSSKPTILDLVSTVGLSDSVIGIKIHQNGLEDMISHNRSNMESEVIHFIQSIYPGRIIEHDRKAISPFELDIYLPDSNIAIECNPVETHNSSHHFMDPNSPGLPAAYHRNKTDKCEEAGIQLFHIFGYEWENQRKIIESMIRNLLGCNPYKIYARHCELSKVSAKECSKFLEDNHRQGEVDSKYRYGLYYNNELVSVITFGKMRANIGTGNSDLSDCYELVRFCNKINTSVVGGASKLFSYFVKSVNPTRIRSFSDRAHTSGKLYAKLGFVGVARSDSSYVWVKENIAYNRVNAMKSNLTKFLKEDVDLTKTEKQIMEEHGYVQVFDSGTITWEWQCDK